MNFCPKCGTDLKVTQLPSEAAPPAAVPAPVPAPGMAEKAEKHEKQEKEEREEKHEKEEKGERREIREFGYMGSLIGGLFLILIGFIFYLTVTSALRWESAWAVFFVLIGIVIIVGAVYAAMTASRRHPRP